MKAEAPLWAGPLHFQISDYSLFLLPEMLYTCFEKPHFKTDDLERCRSMAYMHSKTFDIIFNSNIDGYLDGYFEIDDYIAKPVQILNHKGYKTKFCCSGHPYDTVNEISMEDDGTDPHELMPGVLSIEPLPNGWLKVLVRQAMDCEAYISFDPEVTLPEQPPEGWYKVPDGIRRRWPHDDDPLVCMQNVYAAMKDLTVWAEGLPDLTHLDNQ